MSMIRLCLFSTSLLFALMACDKDPDPLDDHDHDHEEETITSMVLVVADTSGALPNDTFAFRDPDGDGGNAPTVFDTIRLTANTVYAVSLSFLNESETPAEDLTAEIQSEGGEHFVCFDVSTMGVTVQATDSDGSLPIGLQSLWSTGNATQGSIRISLKHQPDIKDGTCTPGSTDAEVLFQVIVN